MKLYNLLNKTFKDSKNKFYNILENALNNKQKMFIVTANPETFMIASEQQEFENILLDKNVTIVPDGIGIVKGAKKLEINIEERIPGVEIVEEILNISNEKNYSIYFYGSKQETLDKLIKILDVKYPNIKIEGLKNGYDYKEDEIFEDIIQKESDIVLVAYGVPKQELMISKYYDRCKKGIFIGVGGSLDVISGYKRRAPAIFRKMNLEWLYRIIKEPSRIKRFYKYNIKFMFRLKKLK